MKALASAPSLAGISYATAISGLRPAHTYLFTHIPALNGKRAPDPD